MVICAFKRFSIYDGVLSVEHVEHVSLASNYAHFRADCISIVTATLSLHEYWLIWISNCAQLQDPSRQFSLSLFPPNWQSLCSQINRVESHESGRPSEMFDNVVQQKASEFNSSWPEKAKRQVRAGNYCWIENNSIGRIVLIIPSSEVE
jgi:hypothetical protein